MELIQHRVNETKRLEVLDPSLGCEIDIRSRGDRLILNHELFSEGDDLEAYLKEYARTRPERTLILNPKEDGLDGPVLDLLKKFSLEKFFFLDVTIPSAVRMSIRGEERRIALRVSEYEPVEHALTFTGRADWVWLDCLDGQPPAREILERIGDTFKICLVSPELGGYPREDIAKFRALGEGVEAVCTKWPEDWS